MFKQIMLITVTCSLIFTTGCDSNVTSEAAGIPVAIKKKKAPEVEQEILQQLVDGNNGFAWDLYHKLVDIETSNNKEVKNIFFSPNSISTALAMTYAGARDRTAEQMKKALHFTLPEEKLHPAFSALIDHLNGADKSEERSYILAIANALWGQKGYNFLPQFRQLLADNYGAGLQDVDFVKATEQARQTINTWVEKQTVHKIKELLQKGILDRLTRLVLTNAIYFKSNWAFQFKKDMTQPAPFMVNKLTKIQVPMMHQHTKFKYYRGKNFQVVDLPYVKQELSMLIFLPDQVDGLKEVESAINSEKLLQIRSQMHKVKLHVYLPKFKTTYAFSVKDALMALGMVDAFEGANFSGMNGKLDLYISAVIHKAFVDVNEQGTEAAAATAVVVGIRSASRPIVFRVDHPFMFVICDNETGSILFMGRIINPVQ